MWARSCVFGSPKALTQGVSCPSFWHLCSDLACRRHKSATSWLTNSLVPSSHPFFHPPTDLLIFWIPHLRMLLINIQMGVFGGTEVVNSCWFFFFFFYSKFAGSVRENMLQQKGQYDSLCLEERGRSEKMRNEGDEWQLASTGTFLYYIMCPCVCLRASQVSSSILYLLLFMDVTHPQTAVQAARRCCWGTPTTGKHKNILPSCWDTHALSKIYFYVKQSKLEMFQKPLLIARVKQQ